MKYGSKTGYKRYYLKSFTRVYKSKVKNDLIRKYIDKIWLECNEDENENYIYIYFKDGQTKIYNAYDDVPMVCTQVPNMKNMDDIRRINDWLSEISYVKD